MIVCIFCKKKAEGFLMAYYHDGGYLEMAPSCEVCADKSIERDESSQYDYGGYSRSRPVGSFWLVEEQERMVEALAIKDREWISDAVEYLIQSKES